MHQAGLEVTIEDPRVDESTCPERDPAARAVALAELKARAVASRLAAEGGADGALVIGADQVAHLDGGILHKPHTVDNQRRQLLALRGRQHALTTGVCLIDGGVVRSFCETSIIHFRIDLSDQELEAYLSTGEGRECCGGYQVEGLGAQLIARIEGDWFNVVGLPVLSVIAALRERGWRPWTA